MQRAADLGCNGWALRASSVKQGANEAVILRYICKDTIRTHRCNGVYYFLFIIFTFPLSLHCKFCLDQFILYHNAKQIKRDSKNIFIIKLISSLCFYLFSYGFYIFNWTPEIFQKLCYKQGNECFVGNFVPKQSLAYMYSFILASASCDISTLQYITQ